MAFMPRTMPSVASMATQRTRPSPRCCCTSRMTLIGLGTVKPSLTTLQRLVNRRHGALDKLHVHGGTGNLNYVSDIFWHKTSAVSY